MKTALTIGVYNPKLICQASPSCGDEVFAKGFEMNGYDVIRFDYRATQTPDKDLLVLATVLGNNISIVWLGKCERIASETIKQLRLFLPDAIFVKWFADIRDEPTIHDLSHNKHIDWCFGTAGGDYLKKHLLPNMIGVGSIIAFADSTYYTAKEVENKYQSDILWTGRRGFGDNELRNEIIDSLSKIVVQQQKEVKSEKHLDIKMFGHSELNPWLGDPNYVKYINGAKIGIGSNSFNRRKYSSDRLGNYMTCGTFYLTQYIVGIEEVFKQGIHLDWFHSIDEMNEKIEYYLENEDKRKEIAKNGQEFILKHFDCKPLVENLLNIIKTKRSKYKWDDVYID